MTWTKNFTNPADETIRESAEKVYIGDLKQEYQLQFAAAVAAAENLIANDERVDGDLQFYLAGYSSGTNVIAPERGTTTRSISVQVVGAPQYVESAPINEADMGPSHNF